MHVHVKYIKIQANWIQLSPVPRFFKSINYKHLDNTFYKSIHFIQDFHCLQNMNWKWPFLNRQEYKKTALMLDIYVDISRDNHGLSLHGLLMYMCKWAKPYQKIIWI